MPEILALQKAEIRRLLVLKPAKANSFRVFLKKNLSEEKGLAK
jgi:hypothetical protein